MARHDELYRTVQPRSRLPCRALQLTRYAADLKRPEVLDLLVTPMEHIDQTHGRVALAE
jgi:hypothetical protein